MSGRLEGKVALITGGTSGIGRCTVERFVEQGARVVFTGRRAELGQAISDETGATFVEADVTREDDVERSIRNVVDTHGRLDVLFNNAGGPAPVGRLETVPLEGFDAAVAVLVRGVFTYMKYAAPIMRSQRSGSIINNGSVAGHRAGYSSSIVYALSKAAVIHLSRCAAMELGEDGVRVNSISPGGIATGIFGKTLGMDASSADATAEKVKGALAKLQTIPRAGLPDDIANAAVYLGCDEASFVNGEDIVVDGGLIWGRSFSEANAGGHVWKQLFE